MSIFEYDKEEEERKLRKAEYEAGVADKKFIGLDDFCIEKRIIDNFRKSGKCQIQFSIIKFFNNSFRPAFGDPDRNVGKYLMKICVNLAKLFK